MKVYTYSDARQQLARVLEEASLDGEVIIKKKRWSVVYRKTLEGFRITIGRARRIIRY